MIRANFFPSPFRYPSYLVYIQFLSLRLNFVFLLSLATRIFHFLILFFCNFFSFVIITPYFFNYNPDSISLILCILSLNLESFSMLKLVSFCCNFFILAKDKFNWFPSYSNYPLILHFFGKKFFFSNVTFYFFVKRVLLKILSWRCKFFLLLDSRIFSFVASRFTIFSFVVIMASVWVPAIQRGERKKFHPANVLIKGLVVLLFINTVGGASLNTVQKKLTIIQEQKNRIEVLKILESPAKDQPDRQ